MKSKMKSLLSLVFAAVGWLTFVSVAHASEELELACLAKSNTTRSGFIVRKIIVGTSQEEVTLRDSNGQVFVTNRYAIISERTGGMDGQPAGERWEVLTASEFSFSQVSQKEYRLSDLKQGVEYKCQLNGIAHANPALTRTN